MLRFFLSTTLFIFFSQFAVAQDTLLEWMAFREQIAIFHPMALQADVQRSMAEAQLLSAKGAFDLKTYSDYEAKQYNKKNYFRNFEAGVKLPTWYGLELKSAYNHIDGDFVNPASSLPPLGQAVIGLDWSLGQGLMIDERRAYLKIARAGIAMGALERRAILNDLFYDAAKAYWGWAIANNQVFVIKEALKQAQIRHEGIRERFIQGESPAIDTLETFIQLQNRQIDLNLAQLDVNNAAQLMERYNWSSGRTVPLNSAITAPKMLDGNIDYAPNESQQERVSQALELHPDLGIYTVKNTQLDIERRLKREQLKPVFNVNYNILGNGWNFFPTQTENGIGVLANDIKWGFTFSMPISNRKARGSLQSAQLKIIQNDLTIQQKRIEITTKVVQYDNELRTLRTQIDLLRNITVNNKILLDAEYTKYQLGESTIFLINTREQRWLDAQIKFIKLVGEYQKTAAGLTWAMGGRI
jgi:outer membrane protein TolC